MKDFFEGMGLGIAVTTGIALFVIAWFDIQSAQHSYQKIHRGEVQCIDTPDKNVYCYEVKK